MVGGKRRVPFSGALKKAQLKEKRRLIREKREQQREMNKAHRAQAENTNQSHINDNIVASEESLTNSLGRLQINSRRDKNIHDTRTMFQKESKSVLHQRRLASQLPLKRLSSSENFIKQSEIEKDEDIDIPTRSQWTPTMSKQQLQRCEEKAFEQWQCDLHEKHSPETLNFYEHNLEVWRQLWRTVEFSHVLLMLVDARHPLFFFSHALYRFITQIMQKPLLIVINKSDLVSHRHLTIWIQYFSLNFPHIRVISFSARQETVELKEEKKGVIICDELRAARSRVRSVTRKKRKVTFNAVGVNDLMNAIGDIVKNIEYTSSNQADQCLYDIDASIVPLRSDRHVIGIVGSPSVGKSCLINSLVARHAVSTSRTPGHTKHIQTIILDTQFILCDCPGIVFPKLRTSRQLQVVMGVFPIAQVPEPFSCVEYVAQRTKFTLQDIYQLKAPLDSDSDTEEKQSEFVWSAWAICEAYAISKHYETAKTARPDTHRAARAILTDIVDGRIRYSVLPPPSSSSSSSSANMA